jgi:hypothetical protein
MFKPVTSTFANSSPSSRSCVRSLFGSGLIRDNDYEAVQRIAGLLSNTSSVSPAAVIPSVAFEQLLGMACFFDVNKFGSLMNEEKKGRLLSSVNQRSQNNGASLSADEIMKDSIHNSWSLNDLMEGSDSD